MAKKIVTNMDIGDASVLDENTSIIHFEGDNDLFFWRTSGNILNPECTIVVPPTHSCIYIKDGKLQDILDGGRYRIFETVEKGGLFRRPKLDAVDVDIIFVNKTVKFKVEWGTKNPVIYRDPLTENVVHVRGGGEFEVKVDNPKQFYLEIIGSDKIYSIDSLKERIDVRLMSYFADALQRVIREKVYSYLDIQMYMKPIGDSILPYLNELMINDVGLKLCSFTVERLGIQEDEAEAIEDELFRRRIEIKEKKEAQEIANELERLSDKAYAREQDEDERKWQRELLLKQLELADKEKYYEVLKIISEKNQNTVPAKEGRFCPHCGRSYEIGSKFCVGCGERLPGNKIRCSCGKELEFDAKFCPECGKKL